MKILGNAVRALPMLAMAYAAARQARNCCPNPDAAPASTRRADRLWDWFYGLDWGEVRTNNFGFSPAEGEGSERFQHQMYGELLKRLRAAGGPPPSTDLLEVSCGRGGGLIYLVRHWPGPVDAVGLDVADSAIRFCGQAYADIPNLRFVRGSALALPFADQSFDVVVNVEASNEYGDFDAFFREVRRVLRPNGAFLYCDSRRASEAAAAQLAQAGLGGELVDITGNVIAACEADTARRLALIASAPLLLRLFFRRQLGDYAAVAGSFRLEEFRRRGRVYLMTCAARTEPRARIAAAPSL
ncbi:MAG TPA: class I SAM-dependent methyltransferase [Allosphingosinicella sp.]|nr:class I SAM-dependent methyltransferase [Allosphingosinicella sp.]